MRKFDIVDSPCSSTGLKCINAHDLSEAECRYVYGVVTNNYVPSTDYKLKIECSPFMQGFQLPFNGDDGYVMVEFWSRNMPAIEAFVKHIEDGLNPGAIP